MPSSQPPIAMLRKCRVHFALRALEYRNREIAPPIREQEAAGAQARVYEKFVSEIDATLRDWA